MFKTISLSLLALSTLCTLNLNAMHRRPMQHSAQQNRKPHKMPEKNDVRQKQEPAAQKKLAQVAKQNEQQLTVPDAVSVVSILTLGSISHKNRAVVKK